MDNDFPASHSMDTRWFAIDEKGHLAIFDSGENGHVPDISTGDGYQLIEEMWRFNPLAEGESPIWAEDLAEKLGVFFYDYDDSNFDPIRPYKRTAVPKTPLHVDQLPPELRKQVKEARLTEMDFSLQELVQPLDRYACVYWYEEDRVAYLDGDGKTVRSIPGMEDRFADFCKQFREANPEEAEKLIFENPKEDRTDHNGS
jgi:hypothetical protein